MASQSQLHGMSPIYTCKHIVKDPRVVFWHRPFDLYKKLFNSEIEVCKCMGGQTLEEIESYKNMGDETLKDILDRFNIRYKDEDFSPTYGMFVNPKTEYYETFGYPIYHDSPIGGVIRVDPGDQVNAAILSVFYFNHKNPSESVQAYYALYNGLHMSVGICFGRM